MKCVTHEKPLGPACFDCIEDLHKELAAEQAECVKMWGECDQSRDKLRQLLKEIDLAIQGTSPCTDRGRIKKVLAGYENERPGRSSTERN